MRYTVDGVVHRFHGAGGWHVVMVPRSQTDNLDRSGSWGYIPVTVTLEDTRWDTSLMPAGNGEYFIALNAKLRNRYGIVADTEVVLTYRVR